MRAFFVAVWLCAVVVGPGASVAFAQSAKDFTLASYHPPADGKTDATAAFARLFADVEAAGGGRVTIPPGTYALAGKEPIRLVGNSRITATGAVFLLPEKLGDQARVVLFAGEDVCDFSWRGGEFRGRCFDPNAESNTWEPNANTRAILLTTSAKGKSRRLLFGDIQSDGVAGAVVTVLGVGAPGSQSEVANYATDITLENCTLRNSGKFMWDYGYLWQVAVWPEEHTDRERALASRYFPRTLIRSGLRGDDRDDRVWFDNGPHPLPVATTSGPSDAVVFFGDTLPENLVRGKQYFIIQSEKRYIQVAERALPSVPTNARVDFAWLVATNGLTDLFDEALAVMAEFQRVLSLEFPVLGFRFAAAQALIADAGGQRDNAKTWSRIALERAAATHSGFRHHARLGLVGSVNPTLERRLHELAGT